MEQTVETLEKQKKFLQDKLRELAQTKQQSDNRVKELLKINDDHKKLNGNLREEQKKHQSEVDALKSQLHIDRETIKKEADELMIKKISKYENAINDLKEDNKKLSQQINDKNNIVEQFRKQGIV